MFIKQEQHEAQQQQLIEVRDSSHTNSGQIGVFNSQSNLYVQISSQEYKKNLCLYRYKTNLDKIQGWMSHWAVYYTSTQCFNITITYALA